jgi:hypothetical protein
MKIHLERGKNKAFSLDKIQYNITVINNRSLISLIDQAGKGN